MVHACLKPHIQQIYAAVLANDKESDECGEGGQVGFECELARLQKWPIVRDHEGNAHPQLIHTLQEGDDVVGEGSEGNNLQIKVVSS